MSAKKQNESHPHTSRRGFLIDGSKPGFPVVSPETVDLPYDPLYDAADDLRQRVAYVKAARAHVHSLFNLMDKIEEILDSVKWIAIGMQEMREFLPAVMSGFLWISVTR